MALTRFEHMKLTAQLNCLLQLIMICMKISVAEPEKDTCNKKRKPVRIKHSALVSARPSNVEHWLEILGTTGNKNESPKRILHVVYE